MKNLHRCLVRLSLLSLLAVALFGCQDKQQAENLVPKNTKDSVAIKKPDSIVNVEADYDTRMDALRITDSFNRWKIKTPYPLPGAILPYKRVVAFYGNLYSKRMGILGELPKDQMIKKLKEEVANWTAADTTIPVIPALHYIAITAQGKAGKDGMHRQRMPHKQIDTIVKWAKEIDGIVFLDVQIGQSTVPREVSTLTDYLKMPQVHLALDPEFAMQEGKVPGRKIGTLSAAEINTAIDTLQKLVKENNLPPKILVIHRFTQGMVTNYKDIKTCPEVQVVMHMDGWGGKALKRAAYHMAVYKEPVQFAGFKLFYKNDTKKPGSVLLTPEEILRLTPKPIYIQYQ
jgi:hypothetical protein